MLGLDQVSGSMNISCFPNGTTVYYEWALGGLFPVWSPTK